MEFLGHVVLLDLFRQVKVYIEKTRKDKPHTLCFYSRS